MQSKRTPLIIASCNGHYQAVDLLVRKGADVTAKDKVCYCVHALVFMIDISSEFKISFNACLMGGPHNHCENIVKVQC